MAESDRRIHPRINFRHQGEALIEQRLEIEIVNLSIGGMGLKTNLPIEPGSICRLVLFQGNVSVESRIVSCTRVPRRRQKYRVGVQFTKVSAQLLDEVLEMEQRFRARESRVQLEISDKPRVTVIHLPDELNTNDVSDMAQQIQGDLDDGVRNFVINFKEVNNLEDDLLEVISEVDDEVKFEDGQLTLANCSSNVLSILTVSQMASAIPIFESVPKAIKAIEKDNSRANAGE